MNTVYKNQPNSPRDKIADIERTSRQRGNLLSTETLPPRHDMPVSRIQIHDEEIYSVDGITYEEILTGQVVWMHIGEQVAPYVVLSINIDPPQIDDSMRFTAKLKEINSL